MPLAINWTPPQDALLHQLRGEGVSWDRIAGVLGVSRNTALERGRVLLGKRMPLLPRQMRVRPVPAPVPAPDAQARPPLPPGHPESWGAITAGTSLDGIPYPAWTLDHLAAGKM